MNSQNASVKQNGKGCGIIMVALSMSSITIAPLPISIVRRSDGGFWKPHRGKHDEAFFTTILGTTSSISGRTSRRRGWYLKPKAVGGKKNQV